MRVHQWSRKEEGGGGREREKVPVCRAGPGAIGPVNLCSDGSVCPRAGNAEAATRERFVPEVFCHKTQSEGLKGLAKSPTWCSGMLYKRTSERVWSCRFWYEKVMRVQVNDKGRMKERGGGCQSDGDGSSRYVLPPQFGTLSDRAG